jgi:hypothetical protein
MSRCKVPYCGGRVSELKYGLPPSEKEAIWNKYYTDAPERRRQCVEKYKIVKRT